MYNSDLIPYLILDASFILSPLDKREYGEFLRNCVILKRLANAKVILPKTILGEVTHKVSEQHSNEPCAVRGINSLLEIPHETFEDGEKSTQEWLKTRVLNLGALIARRDREKPLSHPDSELCAYALIKLKERDVIVASKDKIVQRTLTTLYRPTVEAYLSIGHKKYYLEVIKDMRSLEQRLSGFRTEPIEN